MAERAQNQASARPDLRELHWAFLQRLSHNFERVPSVLHPFLFPLLNVCCQAVLPSCNSHQRQDEDTQKQLIPPGGSQPGSARSWSAKAMSNCSYSARDASSQSWEMEKMSLKCCSLTRNGLVLLLANGIKENNNYSHHLQDGFGSDGLSHSK